MSSPSATPSTAGGEHFRSLLLSSPDLVWVVDADDRITFVSPAVQTHLGWNPESLIGEKSQLLIPPEELDIYRAVVSSIESSPEETTSIELQVLRTDNSRLWVGGTATDLTKDPHVNGIVINVRNIDERHKAEEALVQGSFFDDLTGLPTRALFTDRLDQALRLGAHDLIVKVLYVDIDHFQAINDKLGFGRADELLRKMAARLRESMPSDAIIGRYRNDEFMVARVSQQSNRGELVGAINRMLRKSFELDGETFHASVSIGLATTTREHTTATELISKASAAAQEAKRHGTGQAVTYSQPLDARGYFRRETEGELREAISSNQLVVHYQPVIDVVSTKVVGIEAFVRWNHPQRGLIPPSEFITIAEETGLIVPIGDWVIAETLNEVSTLNRQSDGTRLFASVNISPRQLGDVSFVQSLSGSISRAGLDPGLVHLDITEDSIHGAETHLGGTLRRLRQLGVALALDNFGTGYSSLSKLREAPMTYLKVDRSFTREIGTGGTDLVVGIIAIAHGLNLIPIAEGVETETQFTTLRSLGCAFSQGYLHSRPLPSAELREFLATRELATR